MKVFKFGGASVKNADHFKNVISIVKGYPKEKILLVVSALGKTTNALENVVKDYMDPSKNPFESFNALKENHLSIAKELMGDGTSLITDISDTFIEIEWQLEDEHEDNFDFSYDQIVSVGELVSSKMLNAYSNSCDIKSTWMDARDVIVTDNNYREANVDWDSTSQRINDKVNRLFEDFDLVVTQGFIGSSTENFSTTLGREGSDYTAAIFGYCLNAEDVTIWKDVPGILTGDPRLFKDVEKIDHLSYREAIEMAYYGAQVIHPKTIKPLQNKKIPLLVRSYENASAPGTRIAENEISNYPPIIVYEHKQSLLKIGTKDFSFVAEKHMSLIFDAITKHRIKVKLMKNTAIRFILSVNSVPDRIKKLVEELEDQFNIEVVDDLELITIRHYNQEIIDMLTQDREVLFEERIPNTIQMVARSK